MSASIEHPSAGAAQLLVRTRELRAPGLSAAELVNLLPSPQARGVQVWLRRGEGIVGWGEAARITTSGAGRFADAAAAWRDLADRAVVRDDVDAPGTGPVAFGSFAFSKHSAATSTLVVPEVLIGHRDGRTWITTTSVTAELTPAPTLAQLRAQAQPHLPAAEVTPRPGALAPQQWVDAVQAVIDRIRSGDVAKVVMARDERLELSAPLDVRRSLATLVEAYPTCWTFAVDGLIGATPELLVRRERGLVASRVLAGTIRRSGDDEADLATAASLARSSKDLEEHEFAVESLTRSLRPFAASTNAPETPFVLHLPNVMHLATDVTAVLDHEHAQMSSLDLAAALHPTAAVCGTPTQIAADVIAEHEQMDRERYAAPVGWVGADGDGEWGIALRCGQVEQGDRELRLFAGCGIVSASDPVAELRESEAKLSPMHTALAGG